MSRGSSDEGAQSAASKRCLPAPRAADGGGRCGRQLEDEFALSRRQAYRYLEQAAALSAPVPAVEPTVAITFKLPVSLVRALRAYARRSGLTLGEIVTQALTAFSAPSWRRG